MEERPELAPLAEGVTPGFDQEAAYRRARKLGDAETAVALKQQIKDKRDRQLREIEFAGPAAQGSAQSIEREIADLEAELAIFERFAREGRPRLLKTAPVDRSPRPRPSGLADAERGL